MSFILNTPVRLKRTYITFDPRILEAGHCGLFRAPLHLAAHLMPEMAALIESVPVERPEGYEVDIKVHMLMAGQFPCIPNWHCDNVPRDETGLRYDMLEEGVPPMLLWISDGPCTEFLMDPIELPHRPGSHQEIARHLQALEPGFLPPLGITSQTLEPNHWYSMDQRTPHRGTKAVKPGWRVFARVTPKALAPQRPVTSVIRRHAQVYLDAAEFGW